MKAKKNPPVQADIRQKISSIIIVLLGITACFCVDATAQVSLGGIKSTEASLPSLKRIKKTGTIEELPFSHLDKSFKPGENRIVRLPELTELQTINAGLNNPKQIGVIRPLENRIGKISQGDNFSLANGKVWVAGIVSVSAEQTRLHISNLNLPAGAKLFVYSMNNPGEFYNLSGKSGDFWTQPIEGDGIVIEYFTTEENNLTKNLPFEISEISHIYHNPLKDCQTGNLAPPQLPCHNDVPPEWEELARSVALLQFTLPTGEFLCTGTILNSFAQDFNPVLITANHCFNTQTAAQSLRAYWFYFDGDTPSVDLPRSDGANLLATGAANDYTLVNVLGSIPNILGVAYSGWDSAVTPVGTPVSGLHFPQASHIRYSNGTTVSGYCPPLPSACQNFTGAAWSSGAIEAGSNGSGLWKGNSFETSRLIGTLTNGSIACSGGAGSYSSFSSIYPNISQNLQGGNDDSLDNGNGNDTRANSVAIQPGSYPNLIVKWLDEDWYFINVPAGYKITATANFTNSYGDIDLELYRGAETQPVAFSYSVNNVEAVEHTASGAATYYLAAFLFDGARNNYSLNISLQQVSSINRTRFDFDGDRKTDLSIFRPNVGEWWYLKSSNGGNGAFQFGNSSDRIVPADYTGDGKTDIAFFRPSTNFWYVLRSENSSFYSFPFGAAGDIPAPADYDGDGAADVAVFRPSTATWYIARSTGGTTIQSFGQNGDAPVPADYDGDGKADIAIYRVSSGQWWLQRSSAGAIAFQFGSNTDKPVQGDYTGDGKSDVAFWRPSTGEWFILRSENHSYYSFPFGTTGDLVVPGDYDGDGKSDAAVFRPSNRTWYAQRATAGTLIQTFGITGDKPVPNAFVP